MGRGGTCVWVRNSPYGLLYLAGLTCNNGFLPEQRSPKVGAALFDVIPADADFRLSGHFKWVLQTGLQVKCTLIELSLAPNHRLLMCFNIQFKYNKNSFNYFQYQFGFLQMQSIFNFDDWKYSTFLNVDFDFQ